MSKHDYDVGYKKPPRHTRWQKGQSGNPVDDQKGRSKPLTSTRCSMKCSVR